jgi:hypothetical protein
MHIRSVMAFSLLMGISLQALLHADVYSFFGLFLLTEFSS